MNLKKASNKPRKTAKTRALEQSPQRVVGVLCVHKTRLCIRNLKTQRILPVAASQKSLRALPPNTFFLINGNTIESVLGHLSDPAVDEKIITAQLPHFAFAPSVFAECQSFVGLCDALQPSLYPNRINLCHLPFCTIDPSDAKDFDDAVYYDEINAELYVAIADVSEFVSPFGMIEQEAKKRCFSLYLPHKCLPMLPPILSEELCSLQPLKNRLAFVWKFRLHRRFGKVLRTQCMLAMIQSKARLSYEEVDTILESTPQTPLESMLHRLFAQTSRLRKQRLKTGYDFQTTEYRLVQDSSYRLCKITEMRQSAAHSLIEESMLLANIASAAMLKENFPNALYRTHNPPSTQNLKRLFAELSALGYTTHALCASKLHASIESIQNQATKHNARNEIDRMVIKSFAQACYKPIAAPHFGLGFGLYTHFTSPIRRYVDLCVHRLLKAVVLGKKSHYLTQNLDALCEAINLQERTLSLATLEYNDRIYARAAQELVGSILEATIIMPATATLPAILRADSVLCGARLFVQHCEQDLLQKVRVKIDSVNLLQARIFCKVVGDV